MTGARVLVCMAVVLLAGASRAAAQDAVECGLHVEHADFVGVRVTPASGSAFSVDLTDVEALVVLPAVGDAEIRALAPIALDGTIPVVGVPLRLAADLPLGGGALVVHAGARLVRAEMTPTGVLADLEIAAGVTVLRVPLPCDAIEVSGREDPSATPDPPPVDGPSSSLVAPAHHTLTLLGASDTDRVVLELARHRAVALTLATEPSSGAADRVAVRGLLGTSQVHANVRARDVRPFRAHAARPTPAPAPTRSRTCSPEMTDPHVYVGLAHLREGTHLFTSPGAIAWGEVREGDLAVHLRFVAGQAWAQLRSIRSLHETTTCDRRLEHAFVEASSIRSEIAEERGAQGTVQHGIGLFLPASP